MPGQRGDGRHATGKPGRAAPGRRALAAGALLLALSATGCAGLEPAVKPYERSLLNDPIMDRDRDTVSSRYMRHIQECGEGARGGSGNPLTNRSCN